MSDEALIEKNAVEIVKQMQVNNNKSAVCLHIIFYHNNEFFFRNYVELMESTTVNLIQVIAWHIAERSICWKKIVRKNEPLVPWT